MADDIYVYRRRQKNVVWTSNSSGDRQLCWLPPTPSNSAFQLSLLGRFPGDHQNSATLHQLSVVNSTWGEEVSKNNQSEYGNSSVIAPSESAATDNVEFEFVDSQCCVSNVEKSSDEAEKERVLVGDGNEEVLFREEFHGSQTFDNEDKKEKHEEFDSTVCDVEKHSGFATTQNGEVLLEEARNDLNGSQTWASLDDKEKKEKHQNGGCNTLSESKFAAGSSPVGKNNVKKRRGNSLEKKKPPKRAKIKKVRPKVAFDGRTTKTPQQKPKSVHSKTVPAKKPSETRQKRKYVGKVRSVKKEKNGKQSEGDDTQNNDVQMIENQNHCSSNVRSSPASSTKSSTITDSNVFQFDLQGLEGDLSIVPSVSGKENYNISFEYSEKEGAEFAGGGCDNAVNMEKNLNQCSAVMRSCQKEHFPFEFRKKKRMKRRRKLHWFLGLHLFGRVTKKRSKRPTQKVELASRALTQEGDQILNVGVEQTKLKPELDCSNQPTPTVELDSSAAVILERDKMLNVGAEPTELKPELADCPQISNFDQMIDVGVDQSLQKIDTDYGYLCSKASLIDPMKQTLNGDMEDFLPYLHELVHEEMTGHFPEKSLLFEDANKETFSFKFVDFLGCTVPTKDAAERICAINEENRELMDILGGASASESRPETICGINEENREVMDFVSRAVASGDRAETICGINEENREIESVECCLQLGLRPAHASWNYEANMMGQECSQVFSQSILDPLASELTPVPANSELVCKSTGLNEIWHAPKTPLKINEKNALVRSKGSRKKLSLTSHDGAIVPVTHERKYLPKVKLEEEDLRMWELTERVDRGLGSEEEYNEDPKLQEEINVFQGRIESFTSKMHLVLGDRRFKEWKGSVVDSVVGVFLTQNVSDTLSSSAYMSLAAKYPVQSSSNQGELDDNQKSMHVHGSQYYVTMPETELSPEMEDELENPIEICIEKFAKLSPFSSDRGKENNSGMIEQSTSSTNISNVGKKDLSTDSHVLYLGTTKPENGKGKTTPTGKKKGVRTNEDWESLRRTYERPRTNDQSDSVDWEVVRSAEQCEVASTIKCRGQHTILAGKIQEFLNRIRELHNGIDLEWLRYAPPHIVKEYLLEINGVGLKSTECIRLLALQHIAFPVDTNVGRMAVRLGWVPLKTLPGNLELHLLSDYPPMDDIQKYLWPRIRRLGQRNLYELHYHMITFGKVFCTKRNPNCNACPMRAECRHFASAFASANFTLPGPSNESKERSDGNCLVVGSHDMHRYSVALTKPASVSLVEPKVFSTSNTSNNFCQPIIEEPESPPLVEQDIEDLFGDEVVDCDDEEIPTIKLSNGHFNANVKSFLDKFHDCDDNKLSRAIVPISVEAASISARKQKHVTRLRTEHQVYEIPDSHELLIGLDKRVPDDHVPYLLAIWAPGETAFSCELPTKKCNSEGPEQLCDDSTCTFCESIREENADVVRGTFLIPCSTALKAKFPLNGTYFQVNEVFADHETSYNPIQVPRRSIWNLRRRVVLIGTSTSSIFNGVLSLEKIQENFWKGYVCVRGIDRKTGAPKPLSKRFHCPPSKIEKTKKKVKDENKGLL